MRIPYLAALATVNTTDLEDLPVEEYLVKDQPKRLPLGCGNGCRFQIKPYTGYTDLLLGSLEDDYPQNPYEICRGLLTELLVGIDIDELTLVDAIAILLSIRVKGIGNDLCLKYTCPCEKQRQLIGGETTTPHDLGSFTVRALPTDIPARISCQGIILEPLRFNYLPELLATPKHLMGAFLLRKMAIAPLPDMTITQGKELEQVAIAFHQRYGLENAIGFDCPCGQEWERVLGLGELEYFILGIIKSCRESDRPGATERYLDKISSFLCLGEMAPFKAASEVKGLSIASRNYWIKRVQDTYDKIKNPDGGV